MYQEVHEGPKFRYEVHPCIEMGRDAISVDPSFYEVEFWQVLRLEKNSQGKWLEHSELGRYDTDEQASDAAVGQVKIDKMEDLLYGADDAGN